MMQARKLEFTDGDIAKGLRSGDRRAYDALYNRFYKKLCSFSYKYVRDYNVAEEIVQTLIFRLWDKKETLQLNGHLQPYLFRSVYNNSLEFIRRRKNAPQFNQYDALSERDSLVEFDNIIEYVELGKKITIIKEQLPSQTREIFEMNRSKGLKYVQIAEKLDVSTKTVEYHMSKALKHFKDNLSEYLVVVILFISHFSN